MQKNQKKILIFISVIILVILVILILHIFKNNDENKISSKDESFNKTITDTIDSVNKINVVLDKNNLEKTNDVTYEGDFECFKYIGKDKEEYINLIKITYRYPFEEYSNFKLKDNDLYICFLPSCTVEDIKDYELVIDEENEKSIDIGKGIYTLNKEDGGWKFDFPVINCK